MKKILKISFFSIVGLLTAVILYVVISNFLFLGFKDQETRSYLAKSKVQIKDSINENLFDEDFYQSQVFLLGEFHGFAANQTLDRELLFFLNREVGVKNYVAEMDSLTARKLNIFLAKSNKDTVLLKEVVIDIKKRIPQQSSQELFDKWETIYDKNQKLADSLKIRVIGIDTDFDAKYASISRDSAMLVNFKTYIKKLHIENEKFYGLFGYFHTLQHTPENTSKPFAARLNEAGYKTTSLVSYTIDSEMYLPKNPQIPTPADEKIAWVNADGPILLVKGIKDFKSLAKPNAITLFKINSAASPFSTSQKLIQIKSRIFGEDIVPAKNTVTTDYFQYVFLLRNSEALHQLN